jgi:hypothetical protein
MTKVRVTFAAADWQTESKPAIDQWLAEQGVTVGKRPPKGALYPS